MYKTILASRRFRLLAMDMNLFAQLSLLLIEGKNDVATGNYRSRRKEILEFSNRVGLDTEFVSTLLDVMKGVLPCNKFFSGLSDHRVIRNTFVLGKIVPLKKDHDLKVKDGSWESERIKKIKGACEGSGLTNQAIELILDWLHTESRATIEKALQRK